MLYIYGNIYHQYTPNVSIYTIHGSYGYQIYGSFLGPYILGSLTAGCCRHDRHENSYVHPTRLQFRPQGAPVLCSFAKLV